MTDDIQQEDLHTITDLDTLKVIADPFRIQILELMIDNPITVKTIADMLEVKPNKLYYHVNLMEKRGLIRVVNTEVVSGIIEKWYQAIAKRYTVDPTLLMGFDDAAGELGPVIDSILGAARSDLAQTLQRKPTAQEDARWAMLLTREVMHLTHEQHTELGERLHDLMREFGDKSDPENPEAGTVAATILFYPILRGDNS